MFGSLQSRVSGGNHRGGGRHVEVLVDGVWLAGVQAGWARHDGAWVGLVAWVEDGRIVSQVVAAERLRLPVTLPPAAEVVC